MEIHSPPLPITPYLNPQKKRAIDWSPSRTVRNGNPAHRPVSRRMEVPELPTSMTRDGGGCPQERSLEPELAAETGTLLMECAALALLGDGTPRPAERPSASTAGSHGSARASLRSAASSRDAAPGGARDQPGPSAACVG